MTSLSARLFSAPVFLVCLFGATGVAQRGGLNDPQPVNAVSVSYDTAPGTGVLILRCPPSEVMSISIAKLC